MNRCHVENWKRVGIVLLALLVLARFLIFGWNALLANVNSNSGDQGAYLELGLAIREGKALTDGNRNPLLPLLIAPFARREWSYFTLAKLTSSFCSGLAVLATFLLGWRLHDEWTALLAMTMLTINEEFLAHTSQVLCESLLVLIFFTAWYASVQALKRVSSAKTGFVAGALAGLAYLTKGTGWILVTCFLATALLICRRRLLQKHGFWTFLGGYLLATSPLLVYNLVQYRNPFYNFNTTHAMWLDSWDDRYAARRDLPTLFTYLRTHSLGQILTRQSRGMVTILPAMAQAFLPGPRGWLASWLQDGAVWLAMAIELLLLLSLRHSITITTYLTKRLPRLLITVSILFLFYLLSAWYAPVADEPRFFLPLAPILCLSVAKGLTSLARRTCRLFSLSSSRCGWATGMLVGVLVAGWAITGSLQAWQWFNPFTHDRLANQDTDQVVRWLNDRADNGLAILWGPSHTLPKWKFLPQVTHQAIPSNLSTWEELECYIANQSFQYVVLDPDMYKYREPLLSRYLERDGARIQFREMPPGWTLVFVQEGGLVNPELAEVNWYILELTPPGANHSLSRRSPCSDAGMGGRIQIPRVLNSLQIHAGRREPKVGSDVLPPTGWDISHLLVEGRYTDD